MKRVVRWIGLAGLLAATAPGGFQPESDWTRDFAVERTELAPLAPRVAMDRVEIVSLHERLTTAVRTFDGVLQTEETTPLEAGHKEYKLYAAGVGLVRDGDLVLVRYGKQ